MDKPWVIPAIIVVAAAVLTAIFGSTVLGLLGFQKLDDSQEQLATVVVMLQAEDYNAALQQLDKILEADPENIEALTARAEVYLATEQSNQAVSDYSQVLALQPENVSAYLRRAYAYESLQRIDQALPDYEKALELAPDWALETVQERGDENFSRRNYEESNQIYELILKVERLPIPARDNARLVFRLGIGYFWLEQEQDCIDRLRTAYQLALEAGDDLLAAEIIQFVNERQIEIHELRWTATPSLTPTFTLTPSLTPTASQTPVFTWTPTASASPTPTKTLVPFVPSPTYTNTPKPPPPPSPTPDACAIVTSPCRCDTDRYNCVVEDFPTQAAAQQCFDFCNSQGCGDVHGLDGNQNGDACEDLP